MSISLTLVRTPNRQGLLVVDFTPAPVRPDCPDTCPHGSRVPASAEPLALGTPGFHANGAEPAHTPSRDRHRAQLSGSLRSGVLPAAAAVCTYCPPPPSEPGGHVRDPGLRSRYHHPAAVIMDITGRHGTPDNPVSAGRSDSPIQTPQGPDGAVRPHHLFGILAKPMSTTTCPSPRQSRRRTTAGARTDLLPRARACQLFPDRVDALMINDYAIAP